MGSMIAAMVPDRVLYLALLNAKGGGFQCFPKYVEAASKTGQIKE